MSECDRTERPRPERPLRGGRVVDLGEDPTPATATPSRKPPMTVQVLVSSRDPDALVGLSEKDDELVRQFSTISGPSNIWRLIRGAEAAGYAVVIRSDLPRVE